MTTFLLVADSGTARVFRRDGSARSPKLTEVETLVCPPARLAGRELVSDRTGRVMARSSRALGSPSHARHGIDSESDRHVIERERFAARVARRLDIKRRSGELDALIVVAPARFLGTLRAALSEPTRRVVEREVKRDWVRLTPRDIMTRLKVTRERT